MIASLIFVIHLALFIFSMIIPFAGNTRQLKAYSLLVPFLMLHWATNDDTCVLTMIEERLSNVPKKRTFMGRLLGPIYTRGDTELGKLTTCLFFGLWLIVQYKLGMLSS